MKIKYKKLLNSTLVSLITLNFNLISNSSTLKELEPELTKYNISIEENDLKVINKVYEFWEKNSNKIWKEASFKDTPIVIVFSGKYNIVIGHPNKIENEIFLTNNFPELNKKAVLIKDNTFMGGGAMTSPNFNNTPTVFINTLKENNDFIRNYAKENNLTELLNYEKPNLEYMGTILHEFFHSYQYNEIKKVKTKNKQKPIRLTKIDYPYLDVDINLLLGIEGKILSKLINTSDFKKSKELFRDFIIVRNERRNKLDTDFSRLENYMEMMEGIAQYVGFSLNYASKETLDKSNINTNNYLGDLKEIIIQYNDKLSSPMINRYMTYVYYSGMAQAYVLDKIKPDWKVDFFTKHKSIEELYSSFLNKKLSDRESQKELKRIKKEYNSEKIVSDIKQILDPIKKENERKFNSFNSKKGNTYEFKFEGIEAKNVLVYGPVLLTEHNDYRIFESGASKISYINDDFDEMSEILFEKSVPIFINKKTGIVKFIDENKYNLEIKSDKQNNLENKTIYEGNVSIKNDIFNWKGTKVVITNDKENYKINFIK